MTDKVSTGGCLCGTVRYEIQGDPLACATCYCRQCQYVSGGAPAIFALVKEAKFSMKSGEPRGYEATGQSGNSATRYFCPNCGTPVYSSPKSLSGIVAVKLGSLDNSNGLKIKTAVWVCEAPDWAFIDPALERFEKQP